MITITKEQFFKEICSLRNLWGQKDFWTSDSKVQAAKKGIGVCYLSTKPANPAEEEHIVTAFEATMSEFVRRAMYMGVEL